MLSLVKYLSWTFVIITGVFTLIMILLHIANAVLRVLNHLFAFDEDRRLRFQNREQIHGPNQDYIGNINIGGAQGNQRRQGRPPPFNPRRRA
jgi:uncharacterized membrane protein